MDIPWPSQILETHRTGKSTDSIDRPVVDDTASESESHSDDSSEDDDTELGTISICDSKHHHGADHVSTVGKDPKRPFPGNPGNDPSMAKRPKNNRHSTVLGDHSRELLDIAVKNVIDYVRLKIKHYAETAQSTGPTQAQVAEATKTLAAHGKAKEIFKERKLRSVTELREVLGLLGKGDDYKGLCTSLEAYEPEELSRNDWCEVSR
ncbi:hypothetical protein JX265_014049 [Neoarthrinium moseri]|uniref:Uncharacterized protein n=2 Tax=Neoarthrinium moseri TaxID=1658444 RepID=A0A9P9W7I3_9PEZI|nr:hypothetical protein JX265_014049 [Neoarthrinium moseri]